MTMLELYRDSLARGAPELTVDDLVSRGYSRSYSHVLLHRFKLAGAAVPAGPGKVRLLEPGTQPPGDRVPTPAPWKRSLARFVKTKETGFSVLPQRYGVPRPEELLVPPGRLDDAAAFLRRNYPELEVHEGRFSRGGHDVCLYPASVRGRRATTEEALVHVYRRAPREDFALALQAVLLNTTDLNWHWLQRQPEWPELAGVFLAVNEATGRRVFPDFRTAQPPDLTFTQLATVAQAFTARGTVA